METWNDVDFGIPPVDHRACLLGTLDPEYVWVDHCPAVPVNRSLVLPMLRWMLCNPPSWPQMIQLLSMTFWDPKWRPRCREIRQLHFNERNWPLLPYVPPSMRKPLTHAWEGRLMDTLRDRHATMRYNLVTRCQVCGQH